MSKNCTFTRLSFGAARGLSREQRFYLLVIIKWLPIHITHWMSLPSIEHILLVPRRKRRDSIVENMDLSNLLNTNMSRPAAGYRNMQYEVPLPVSMSHDLNATHHYAQQNLYVPNGGHSRIKSETGSERGVSPHTSDHSSRYSSQTPQNPLNYTQLTSNLTNGMARNMRYPSPSQQQQQNNMMPLIQHSYHPNASSDQSYQQAQLGAVQQAVQPDQSSMDGGRNSTGSTGLPKAFACSTCAKGFARRSDLARHGM